MQSHKLQNHETVMKREYMKQFYPDLKWVHWNKTANHCYSPYINFHNFNYSWEVESNSWETCDYETLIIEETSGATLFHTLKH